MSDRNTARFFDSKMALLGGGALVAGLAVGAYCVMLVINERKISIGGFLFSAFLLLMGIAFFFGSFPKGCRSCKKRFAEAGTTFPAQNYDQVVATFQPGNVGAIASLASVPEGSHEGWTGLGVHYCAGCRQLGEVTVSEQKQSLDGAKYVRGTSALTLSPLMLSATLDMLEHRPGANRLAQDITSRNPT